MTPPSFEKGKKLGNKLSVNRPDIWPSNMPIQDVRVAVEEDFAEELEGDDKSLVNRALNTAVRVGKKTVDDVREAADDDLKTSRGIGDTTLGFLRGLLGKK